MNLNRDLSLNFKSMKCFILLPVACALLAGGCDGTPRASVSQNNPEIERLREENENLEKLRADNEESQRLRKENQDIHKLRGQYQELAQVRKEHDDLQKQMAKLGMPSARTLTATAQAVSTTKSDQQVASLSEQPPSGAEASQPVINEKDLPQEGDEVYVEPKFLAVLLPDIDWTKLDRTEPIAIQGLLGQQGIVLTNYQELISRGITNYVVRRASKPTTQEQKTQ